MIDDPGDMARLTLGDQAQIFSLSGAENVRSFPAMTRLKMLQNFPVELYIYKQCVVPHTFSSTAYYQIFSSFFQW